MSVREYIGARYIPLFSDPLEWDSTRSYEPLTVVKNQGSSYVSRQYVPEGVAITNEQYWILWADFNAQLEQYRAEVRQFDGRITANADAIADEVEARAAADTALGGDIAAETRARQEADSTISGNVAALTERVVTLETRKIVIFGDSYGLGTHSDSATSGNTSYLPKLQSLMPNADISLYAQGGIGFWRAASSAGKWSGMKFSGMVGAVAQTIAADVRAKVDSVLFQGGWNDGNHYDEQNNADFHNAIEAAKNAFPNAKIYVLYTYGANPPIKLNWARAFQDYQNRAAVEGCVFGESINIVYVLGTASYDDTHPTANQQNYIAGLMCQLLMDGYSGDYWVNRAASGSGAVSASIDPFHTLNAIFRAPIPQAVTPSSVPMALGTSLAAGASDWYCVGVMAEPWQTPVIRYASNGTLYLQHAFENSPQGALVYGILSRNIMG